MKLALPKLDRKLLRDPWGLERGESRYTTAEIKALAAPDPERAPEPEDNGHSALVVGRVKGKRTPRR